MKHVDLEYCEQLASAYKYLKLDPVLSEKVRERFLLNLGPELLSLLKNRSLFDVYTPNGSIIGRGCKNIVIGDYGAFIEIEKSMVVNDEMIVKPGQEFRYDKNFRGKYKWLTIDDGSDVKIYLQIGTVVYAKYKIGCYYVSPHEVKIIKNENV